MGCASTDCTSFILLLLGLMLLLLLHESCQAVCISNINMEKLTRSVHFRSSSNLLGSHSERFLQSLSIKTQASQLLEAPLCSYSSLIGWLYPCVFQVLNLKRSSR